MSDAVVTILEGKTDVACAVAAALVERIREVQSRGEEAQLALTGGSLGSLLWSAVVDLGDTDVDWSNVRVWWGDERWLPAGDPDRNDVQNDDAGLAALGLDPAKVHRVQGPDLVATPEDAAAAYGETIREFGKGAWDVGIFGVGPDGHVASLFPHHPAQRITDEIAVAVHDSPKPPPTRVSLTFECFERSDAVWLIVSGADKAQAVADGVPGTADAWDVPCGAVHGTTETVWFIDQAAAGELP
ncbi:MAG: 6-phosphogluconolactonase [Phycicoccus sp.]|nr:6-phosphogluconolactonase [Phycicoccus sp.]